MSGSVAYVLDEHGELARQTNPGMVELDALDAGHAAALRATLKMHAQSTGFSLARTIPGGFERYLPALKLVIYFEYRSAQGDIAYPAASQHWHIFPSALMHVYTEHVTFMRFYIRHGVRTAALCRFLLSACKFCIFERILAMRRAALRAQAARFFHEASLHCAKTANARKCF